MTKKEKKQNQGSANLKISKNNENITSGKH